MLKALSTLRAIAEALGSSVARDAPVTGVSIDSRTIQPGELFVAVRGASTDGHLYIDQALAAGAAGVVAEHDGTITVKDSLAALQALGAETRRRWGKKVVAVTGSVGKTTTKEMIAAVLARRYRVLKTEGNFNNEYGLPLSLLRLQDADEIAVLELGMSHAGEIAALAKLCRPDVGVVTCVAPVHLEFFDSVDAVARAKYELIEALPPDGVAVLNADDARVAAFAFAGCRVMYGLANTPPGLEVPLPGRHNVLNALAAIAVGSLFDVSLDEAKAALRDFHPAKMRGEIVASRGARLVNDCYNSNPVAALAMLDWLMETPNAGRRAAVLGEMLELGPAAAQLHREVGARARTLDLLIGVRGLAREIIVGAGRGDFVETPEEAAAILDTWIRPGDLVLFKASRGVRLERALTALMTMEKAAS
jgi:UDP-N-acetylmuramoyl-tripeptide--D-alanyl-D-alanine ligase